MRLPTTAELLQVWEHARRQPPFQQALLLLGAALPDCSAEELLRLSLGRRDLFLLELRALLFGLPCQSLTQCPRCAAPVELSFSLEPWRAADKLLTAECNEFALEAEGYCVQGRWPNSADLASLWQTMGWQTTGAALDEAAARNHLLERCVTAITRNDGQPAESPLATAVPVLVSDAIANQLAEAAPQSDIQLAVDCPACRHQWIEFFDIGAWLMAEINDWAQRLLREVHALALAYHWRESDILLMSATRRRAYLELLGRA